ncbi:hypothetical protein TNCV_1709581 [Trichonephila clavipes]|nr:hypothetical protein TNCV_1709581 [Trichonephila clavipes]
MALSDSLPQINLGVQDGTQEGSHKVIFVERFQKLVQSMPRRGHYQGKRRPNSVLARTSRLVNSHLRITPESSEGPLISR